MIPLLLMIGVAGVLYSVGQTFGKPKTETKTSGVVFQTQQVERFKKANPYLYALLVKLKRGDEPDEWLINEAMAEAYDKGNWGLVAKLHRKFGDLAMDEGDEEDGGDEESDDDNEGPERPTDDDGPVEIVVGKNSPFDGVPNDAWDRFVSNLETQKPDYEGPKHVGRYHHSRERLSQLGINDVSTADKQYDALVKDLTDSREKSNDLIADWECKSIALAGNENLITLSGILAVVKSAGLDNARSWFERPEDRTKFPKTTEMFLKANGVF